MAVRIPHGTDVCKTGARKRDRGRRDRESVSCLRTIRGTSSPVWIRTDFPQPSDYGSFSSEDDDDDW